VAKSKQWEKPEWHYYTDRINIQKCKKDMIMGLAEVIAPVCSLSIVESGGFLHSSNSTGDLRLAVSSATTPDS
jgi:hypothetical protein